MKKIWKMKKDAVSPVIATILMVAITVVLAAVLYVMVMGFGGPTESTPTGAFTQTQKLSATTEKVQFGVITPTTNWDQVKIIVSDGTNSETYVYASGAYTVVTSTVVAVTGIAPVNLGGDAAISNGDSITITLTAATTPAVSYTVTMLYTPTNAAIDDITFSW
ncbi:MAG: type IV pilin N-terminal domain-containing protein [Methanomassiliicoccales archaeon]|nr:type IV pilin N-terminal domain-containing protein [Methanomassiliicoccales archaeon]